MFYTKKTDELIVFQICKDKKTSELQPTSTTKYIRSCC